MGEPTHRRVFEIPATHPALQGHFPDMPVVPGALLLSLVEQATLELRPDASIATLKWAKFLGMVLPDQRVVIALRALGDDIAFEGRVDEVVILSGVLALTGKAAAP